MKKGFFIFVMLIAMAFSADSIAKKRSKKTKKKKPKTKVSRTVASIKNVKQFDFKLPKNWKSVAKTSDQHIWQEKKNGERIFVSVHKRYSNISYKYIRNNFEKILKHRHKYLKKAGISRFKLKKKKFFKAPGGKGIVLQMKGSYTNSNKKKTQFEEWQLYTKDKMYTLLFNRRGQKPVKGEASKLFKKFRAID